MHNFYLCMSLSLCKHLLEIQHLVHLAHGAGHGLARLLLQRFLQLRVLFLHLNSSTFNTKNRVEVES